MVTWREAVWAAIRRQGEAAAGPFTREQLVREQLPFVVQATGSRGMTPAQTMSRVLQELRDEGVVIFDGNGRYRLSEMSSKIADVEAAVRTQAERRIQARVGQGRFRRELLQEWGCKCPLTGIAEADLLRASHIVPWGKCRADAERLDPKNGILLSALWDAAFDKGLVTFADAGEALVASAMELAALAALRAAPRWSVSVLPPQSRERLAFHRALHSDKRHVRLH